MSNCANAKLEIYILRTFSHDKKNFYAVYLLYCAEYCGFSLKGKSDAWCELFAFLTDVF